MASNGDWGVFCLEIGVWTCSEIDAGGSVKIFEMKVYCFLKLVPMELDEAALALLFS